jgi:hypothetical protein
MRAATIAAMTAALALAAGGCGGSNTMDAQPKASEISTTDAFVHQADAVCAKAFKGLILPSQTSDELRLSKSVAAWQHRKITGMEAVHPPASVHVRFDRYMAAMKARSRLFDRYLAVIRAHQSPGDIERIQGNLMSRERLVAERLGLGGKCSI